MSRKGTVLLVEDDESFAHSVAPHLQRRFHVRFAASVHEALSCLGELGGKVCAVIIDVILPDGSGLELIPIARERLPGVPVLVLTRKFDRALVNQLHALEAEYVLKDGWEPNLKAFIRRVLAAELSVGDRDQLLVEAFARRYGLTARETEIILLSVADMPREAVARKLGISVWTLKSHIRKILHKCEADSMRGVARMIRADARDGE